MERDPIDWVMKLSEREPEAVLVANAQGKVVSANRLAQEWLDGSIDAWQGRRLDELFVEATEGTPELAPAPGPGSRQVTDAGGRPCLLETGESFCLAPPDVLTAYFVRDPAAAEAQEAIVRRHRKLEGLGELAAGIAHEINTPIQFVGDSASFLADAWGDLEDVLTAAVDLREAATEAPQGTESVAHFDRIAEEADLAFLRSEIPLSIERMREGVRRVARIARAMKSFSHPGDDRMAPADLNEAIESTAIVAKNETKYVAEVRLDLGELAPVSCHVADFQQVILNLLVNAAHAVGARSDDRPGSILIRTRDAGDEVVVEVTDDGVGMAPDVVSQIFEPSFTTKSVGQGTGRGLALARSIICEKHRGTLDVESVPGEGTSFRLTLPRGAEGA